MHHPHLKALNNGEQIRLDARERCGADAATLCLNAPEMALEICKSASLGYDEGSLNSITVDLEKCSNKATDTQI